MAVPHLTAMRRALWAALDASQELRSEIKTRYKWEDSGATLPPELFAPSIGDCPALSIFPAQAATPWITNQEQGIVYALAANYWTPEWNVLTAERLWELINRAFWQSTELFETIRNDSTIGFPAQVTRIASEADDEPDLLKVAWLFELRANWNPRLETHAFDY